MYSTPIVDVAQTSAFKSMLLISFGIVLVSVGTLFILKIKKKNNEI